MNPLPNPSKHKQASLAPSVPLGPVLLGMGHLVTLTLQKLSKTVCVFNLFHQLDEPEKKTKLLLKYQSN